MAAQHRLRVVGGTEVYAARKQAGEHLCKIAAVVDARVQLADWVQSQCLQHSTQRRQRRRVLKREKHFEVSIAPGSQDWGKCDALSCRLTGQLIAEIPPAMRDEDRGAALQSRHQATRSEPRFKPPKNNEQWRRRVNLVLSDTCQAGAEWAEPAHCAWCGHPQECPVLNLGRLDKLMEEAALRSVARIKPERWELYDLVPVALLQASNYLMRRIASCFKVDDDQVLDDDGMCDGEGRESACELWPHSTCTRWNAAVAPCITILETLLLLLLHMLHMLLLHMLLLRMLLLALLRMLLHMLRMRMLLLLQELHMLPCKLLLLLMLRLKSSLFCFKISFFVCFASPGHGHRKPISHGTAPQRHRTWPTKCANEYPVVF